LDLSYKKSSSNKTVAVNFSIMDLRASTEKLLNTQNPGVLLSLCLLPLTLASFIFYFIVLIRSTLYKIGIFKSYKAECKVTTIGNLTVGGTGKTPTVCLLAKHFKESGFRTAVVCRGYRGKNTDIPMVVSDKEKVLMDSESAGDEACMLARKLPGIPVLAGKNRISASKMACDLFNCEIIILDDGFQHLSLKRDTDVVLINSRNPFGNGFLLPRGILREPLNAIKRA
jgi:tetraacyldisaccharide 4'-kinase